MNKKIKRLILILSLLLCFANVLLAQNSNKNQPLAQIITSIQAQYGVQFNYAEDLIKNVYLPPQSFKTQSLKNALAYLEKYTNLSFVIMSDRIILVKPNEELVFCGYIKDEKSLTPIVNATIQGVENATISDENGFFKLELKNPSEQINIRFLGYKTLSKSFSQNKTANCNIIFLQRSFLPLSEIIISNYIVNGINKINNGSYEIDFSNFDILPGLIETDVLQSVQAFSGIQSSNETVSNINIRGGSHDQNLILWDGIKMYQSGHFFGLISMYHPQITQKVSLIKNGSSVAQTDGVSGTIAMQTDKSINSIFKGVVAVNLIDFNGFVDVPISKKSSIQIAARKSISNFFETPTYTSFFKRISQDTEVEKNTTTVVNTDENFDFYDMSLRWIYKINDKDEVQLNFINVYNELLFNENAVVNERATSRESSLKQNSIAGGLHYKRTWNDKLSTLVEVYETDYKLKAVNVNLLDSQRFLQKNVVSETSLKLKADYKINNKLQLLSGYHFVETEVTNLDDIDDPLYRLLVSEVLRTHGVFSQIGYSSLNNNTRLNFGLRYNYISKFKKQIWEPRLSFSQKFLSNFMVEILGEFKHQNTSQVINFQNDFLGIEKRRWQLSNNNDIPVIRSKQLSTGISFNKKGWLFNIEGYYKKVNGITSQSQGFQNQYEFSKASGSYDVLGFDILFRKKTNKFNTWLSYGFMDNKYRFKDLENNSFPSNYNVIHTATLGMVYDLTNLKISTGINWHSGKPTTLPIKGNEIVNNNINFGNTNAANLKDYIRWDISALYDFKLGKNNANIGVSVWNVLDRENEIGNFYRVNNDMLTETKQRSLGITPNAVFRVCF